MESSRENFIREKNKLKYEIDEEYKLYSEVPEIHPEYESRYGFFMNQYQLLNTSGNEEHKEETWVKFWTALINKLKEENWTAKYNELVSKYPKDVVMEAEAVSQPAPSPVKFTIENAINLIEEVSDEVGVVGSAIKSITTLARKAQLGSIKSNQIISVPDNVMILSMLKDNCKSLSYSVPDKKLSDKFVLCVEWVDKLISHCKSNSTVSKMLYGIDIEEVASITAGRDSVFVIRMLTDIVDKFNLRLTTDQMEEVVQAIKSLH